MKKYIIKIVLFFTGWLAITIIIDFFYTNYLRNSNIREIVIWNDIFNSKIDADIVYIGSSRTADHYQPEIIDSILGTRSYNLGQYGQTIESDIIRYKLLQKYEDKTPSLYVWDVYFASFNSSSKFQDEQYTPFLFNNDIWTAVNSKSTHFSIFDKYVPLLRYWRKGIIPKYEALKDPIRGFVYNIDTWNPDEIANLKEESLTYSIDESTFNEFCSTIDTMKKEGADVIIVFSPLHIKGQKAMKNLDHLIYKLDSVSSSKQCLFKNYLSDPICYDSSYFKNAMHLNEEGTDFFSAKFARLIDSLYNMHL